jgi:hypothetical protein
MLIIAVLPKTKICYTMIHEITLEQADLIPAYREKWRQIALYTQPIDRHKAAESILNARAISF